MQAALRMSTVGEDGRVSCYLGRCAGMQLPAPNLISSQECLSSRATPGILIGHQAIPPLALLQHRPQTLLLDPFRPHTPQDPMGSRSGKRTALDETELTIGEQKLDIPPPRKKYKLYSKGNSFPLPAVKENTEKEGTPAASMMKLASFVQLWESLSDSKMQAELFRRKLHEGNVPLTEKTQRLPF